MASRRKSNMELIVNLEELVTKFNNENFGGDCVIISSIESSKNSFFWLKKLDKAKCKYYFLNSSEILKEDFYEKISEKIGVIITIGDEKLLTLIGAFAFKKDITSILVCDKFCNLDILNLSPQYFVLSEELLNINFLKEAIIVSYYEEMLHKFEKYLSFKSSNFIKISKVCDFNLPFEKLAKIFYNRKILLSNKLNLSNKLEALIYESFDYAFNITKVLLFQMLTKFFIKLFRDFSINRKELNFESNKVLSLDFEDITFSKEEFLINETKLEVVNELTKLDENLSKEILNLKNFFLEDFYQVLCNCKTYKVNELILNLINNSVNDYTLFKLLKVWYLK